MFPERGLQRSDFTDSPGCRHWLQPYFPLNCTNPCIGARATESTQHTNGKILMHKSAPFILHEIHSVESLFIFSTKGPRKTFISGLSLPNHNPTTINSFVRTLYGNSFTIKYIGQIE